MQIGILKETKSFENRVAITPEIVKKLISLNHSILIQKDAGKNSFISN